MMNVQSPGRQTDFIFARFSGEVIAREHYTVIRTPNNPGYHWGNYLIFDKAPHHGDLEKWTAIFKEEFPYYLTLNHLVFTWDSDDTTPGAVQEFLDAGFALETAHFLTASKVNPPTYPNIDIHIKVISSDSDWLAVVKNQVRCADPKYHNASYEDFKVTQMKAYRAMSEAGMGNWFGAYRDGQLLGDLGIFFEHSIGRFQNVETHPDFRRQGICSTLVYECSQIAFQNYGVRTLVMEADAHYHAARIYESVGYEKSEINHSLSWWRGKA